MTPITVPYRLRRGPKAPAEALLFPGRDARLLLETLARWPGSEMPRIYALPSGLLIRLPESIAEPTPFAVRLRALAANLFIPADSQLSPALLPDEAAALTRGRGLLFLPDGNIEAFDPVRPLTANQLLRTAPRVSSAWSPLPVVPLPPERLVIQVEPTPLSPDELLAPGGESIGVEAPRPPRAGPLATLGGHAAAALGRGLAGLGSALRAPGLATLGGWLIGGAARLAPRITESLLGRQEAALRELLRLFQAGDLEQALRRALPLGDSGGRGDHLASSAELPWHNLHYSLSQLLGQGGAASVWLGGGDIHARLAEEYRRAAADAVRRGDYRRAAFIHAKLLRDYRQAAAVLEKGGLHRDAAVLYLKLLRDPLAAARAYESAGDLDQALALYRENGEYALAGDLLRRLGEHEAALAEFERAATQLAERDDHASAGELILRRAGRRDRALEYFHQGWSQRRATSLNCLLRLASLYAEEPSPTPLLNLVDEADAYFGQGSAATIAANFYNELGRLADLPARAAQRDDLRDRALVGLATQLRQRVGHENRPAEVVSELFGRSHVWSAGTVRDAEYAFRAAVRERTPLRSSGRRIADGLLLAHGEPTAFCAARQTGQIFVGFADGRIIEFDPIDNSMRSLEPGRLGTPRTGDGSDNIVFSLAVAPRGQVLAAAAWRPSGTCVFGWERAASGLFEQRGVYQSQAEMGWLTPTTELNGVTSVGFHDGENLSILEVPSMMETGFVPIPSPRAALHSAVPFQGFITCLRWVGTDVHYYDAEPPLSLGWHPDTPAHVPVLSSPFAWLREPGGAIELAAVNSQRSLCWTRFAFDYRQGRHCMERNLACSDREFLAAALIGPGRIAAAARDGIHWFRATQDAGLSRWLATDAALEGAFACYPSPMTGELLLLLHVAKEVRVARVPISM